MYILWRDIKNRCLNPRNKSFKNYGGRGITICERWRDSYEAFRDDVGPRPGGRRWSLDRIDNDGPYGPENVRWATRVQQNNNKRGNRLVTINGETLTFSQWIKRADISPSTAYYRIKRGWSLDRALTTPT